MMLFREKKLQEKNKKTFILDDNIVKHLQGHEISNHVENCKVSGKGMNERLSPANSKREPRSYVNSHWY